MFLGAPVHLLAFDLDGTLIDSRVDLATAVNAMLRGMDRGSLAPSTIGGFIGDGAAMLVDRSLAATGETSAALLEQAMPLFLRSYQRHLLDHTYVYDGVLEALGILRQSFPDLPMAVLTNKPVGPSRHICDALGLSAFFCANYGGNSFATKKPDPAGLIALLKEASVLLNRTVVPAATVLVRDSEVDVKTARAAGARMLGCTYGFATEAMLAEKPDVLVDSAAQWPYVLGVERTAVRC